MKNKDAMGKLKEKSARQKARDYVGSGSLRSVLEQSGNVEQDIIDKIVDAACFGLGC